MRLIPVLMMAVAIVLIGACGNANSESATSAESELRQCVTTLVFAAATHKHTGSLSSYSNSVFVGAPHSGVDITEALDGYCEGFIDYELLATLQSGATGIVPTTIPTQETRRQIDPKDLELLEELNAN